GPLRCACSPRPTPAPNLRQRRPRQHFPTAALQRKHQTNRSPLGRRRKTHIVPIPFAHLDRRVARRPHAPFPPPGRLRRLNLQQVLRLTRRMLGILLNAPLRFPLFQQPPSRRQFVRFSALLLVRRPCPPRRRHKHSARNHTSSKPPNAFTHRAPRSSSF